MHREVFVCSISRDEQRATLLLRREPERVGPPGRECRNGRAATVRAAGAPTRSLLRASVSRYRGRSCWHPTAANKRPLSGWTRTSSLVDDARLPHPPENAEASAADHDISSWNACRSGPRTRALLWPRRSGSAGGAALGARSVTAIKPESVGAQVWATCRLVPRSLTAARIARLRRRPGCAVQAGRWTAPRRAARPPLAAGAVRAAGARRA